jgi:hypothetical protein
MSIINDNLINSIIRLRVSLELGHLSEQIQNSNSILNRIHRNNIFYNIITSESGNLNDTLNDNSSDNMTNQRNINNMYDLYSDYYDLLNVDRNDTSNTSNTNTPFVYSNYHHMNTDTFLPPRIINDMSGLLVANILSSILDPYVDYVNSEDETPVLTEEEFNRLHFINIDKENPLLASQCSICLDDFKMGETCVSLKCKHTYHKECIKNWLIKQNSKCPTCRMCCKENL